MSSSCGTAGGSRRVRRIYVASLAISLLAHAIVLPIVARLYQAARFRVISGGPDVSRMGHIQVAPPDMIRITEPTLGERDQVRPAVGEQVRAVPSGVPASAVLDDTASATAGGRTRATEPLPSRFSTWERDPRLYLPGGIQPLPATSAAALSANARANLLAEGAAERASRQIEVLGMRMTVVGDSAAARSHRLTLAVMGERAVMPGDTREWQQLEMDRQRTAFSRDSVLRERIEATRSNAALRRLSRESRVP